MINISGKISLEDAERILADAKPECCFWVNNGPIIRNLHEMASALDYMGEETFRRHVNGQKNDIANWVRDVLRDEGLAGSIGKNASKEKISKKIKSRIKFLENMIEQERLLISK